MKIKNIIERVMSSVFFFCGMVSIAAVLLITAYMVIAGLPAILEIGPIEFLFGTVWQSTASTPKFGILPFILTSIWAWRRCHRCPHRRMYCHLSVQARAAQARRYRTPCG